MEFKNGTILEGYKLEERVGSGGFGAVYRARQTTVGREVAIKIILPGFANNPDFIRRFESEAQLIARLEHPHITPLHDYWRNPDGAYLVMRYLRGGSVRDSLQDRHYELHDASQLLDQIASALDFAHRNAVIHRDIKPGNILLDEDGNAYLADFGIAKDLAGFSNNQTQADAVVGSLDYISPEQARSEPVTPRTDIYSLGVTLYEMITGEHPFHNTSSVERLYKHINDPLPPITRLPTDTCDVINDIIQKATAKDPDQRYPDVLALAVAFREALGRGATQNGANIVEQLTMREQEILSMIARGMSNGEIAAELVVTMATVKWHVTQLYKKLSVRSRVQAIVRARELHLIVTGDTADDLPNLAQPVTAISLPEPENPYKGLHAFQTTDSRDFFGRNDLTQKLLTQMQEHDPYKRFLAIVGPSGSGKSSLVKAGVIPALWKGALPGSEKWFVVDMIPGTHPFDKLETALVRVAANQAGNLREQLQRDDRGLLRVADIILPGDDTELVIVVDQFEEVFTLVEDEAVRQQFLDLIRVAVSDVRSRVRVIVTMRADYYDRPLHYPEFGELVRNRMETVLPLTAKGLERAIRGPAERVGVAFEQGLVEHIVSAMNYQAGALPLLQYALTELFDRRAGRILTNDAYQQIGGAVGALANRADEIFHSLTDEAQALAHQMFMRLVTLGEGAEDTRRRATQAELYSLTDNIDLMEEIIDQFAAYRLLSLDHDPETRLPTVEVAHEAILREWDTLRKWLNDSRDDIRQERLVSRAADEWQQHNRDDSYLLRGARLEQAEKWQQSSELVLTPLERTFIDSSINNREHEQQAETERQAREVALERRSRTVLRVLVAVFALATVIAGGLSILALSLNSQSQRSAAEFRSVALSIGAQDTLNSGQPDVALGLAREAVNMDNPPFQSQQALYTVAQSNWMQQRFTVSTSSVFDAIYHPDGERIIVSSWDGRVTIWNIESGEMVQSLELGEDETPTFIDIHPDGQSVIIAGFGGILRLWNLDTEAVTVLDLDRDAGAPRFTADGTQLVTGNGGAIVVWDWETLEPINTWEAHRGPFLPSIQFSPDGTLIATAGRDGFVKIWDFETGELIQSLDNGSFDFSGGSVLWDALFLPDGERLLTVGENGVFLWDWQSGENVWAIDEGVNTQDIALSPDGLFFVVGLNDPTPIVRLREVETGRLIREYRGHGQRVANVDFSADGMTFLSASNDGTVAIWLVNWEGAEQTMIVNSNNELVWHPSQPWVATVGVNSPTIVDNTIRLVHTQTGEVVRTFTGHWASVRTLTFTPDGRYLLSGDWGASETNEQVYVWDVETGERIQAMGGHTGIRDIAVSPDSQIVAVGDANTVSISLWNLETDERIRVLEGHDDWVEAVGFSPNGQMLYSGGRDGTLFQWDVATGELMMRFAGHSISIHDIDLNSDGTRLVTASLDGTAIIWDTQTGAAILTLRGHSGSLNDAAFNPDNSMILTGSDDGTIILWDAQTGERVRTYVMTDSTFRLNAAFSPDGTQIVSSANDIITIWDATPLPGDFVTWIAEHRYIPDFTCEQRALYRIEPLCAAD